MMTHLSHWNIGHKGKPKCFRESVLYVFSVDTSLRKKKKKFKKIKYRIQCLPIDFQSILSHNDMSESYEKQDT